jgi:hypothetical protein
MRRPRGGAGADPARPPGRPRPEAAGLAREATSPWTWACRWRSRAACAGRQVSRRRRRGTRRAASRRARRDGGGRLRPDPAALGAGAAAPRLPEHPRLAAAALARRGTHPPRHRSRRHRTGITIMQMDAGLDTGAMLLVQRMPIMPTTPRPRCTTAWRPWARAHRAGAGRSGPGALAAATAADAGRELRAQDREGEAEIDWPLRRPAGAACGPLTPSPVAAPSWRA